MYIKTIGSRDVYRSAHYYIKIKVQEFMKHRGIRNYPLDEEAGLAWVVVWLRS
jgi:hypothetical protein